MTNDSKMIIGFDLDGVILDQSYQKVRIANNLGFDLKLEETDFSIIESRFSGDVVEKIKSELYGNPAFALRAHLMEGVVGVLGLIKSKHYPYYLVSRRRQPEMAVNLLERLGLWPSTFNSVNSFFVASPNDKNEKARDLKISHYIDDEVKIITTLQAVEHKFLFDRFDVLDSHPSYNKLKSWYDFHKLIV